MKKILFLMLCAIGGFAWADYPASPVDLPYTIVVASSAAQGVSARVQVSTGALFSVYQSTPLNAFTNVHIEAYSSGATSGGVLATCSTVNMTTGNTLSFNFVPVTPSTGTLSLMDMQFANPLQAPATGFSSITCPATAGISWNIILGYLKAR